MRICCFCGFPNTVPVPYATNNYGVSICSPCWMVDNALCWHLLSWIRSSVRYGDQQMARTAAVMGRS